MADMNDNNRYTEEDTISLLDLLSVLAKHWRFIFFSTLTAAVLIFCYSLYSLMADPKAPLNFLPNVYKPQVKVRLQESESASLSSLLNENNLGVLSGLVSTNISPTNAELARELLKGKTLIDQVAEEYDFIEKYDISEYPKTTSREIFTENLAVEHDSATGILTIGYKDINREFATDVLNRTLQLLEKRFQNLTMETVMTKKRFLEERLEEVEKEYRAAQQAVVDFQKNYGLFNLELQASAMIEEIAKLESEIMNTELKLRQLQEARRSDDPQVQRLQNELELLKEMLQAKQRGLAGYSDEYISQSEFPELSAVYLNLKSELAIQETIYRMLRQQYETTKIEESDNSRKFQVIEYAEIPEKKDSPSRGKICIIVTLAVFFLSILISFIMEYFSRVKKDPVESDKLKTIKKQLPFFRKP